MTDLKVSLVDNDYKVRAKTDLGNGNGGADALTDFISHVKEELVTGQTAYLEIEGDSDASVRLAVSLT